MKGAGSETLNLGLYKGERSKGLMLASHLAIHTYIYTHSDTLLPSTFHTRRYRGAQTPLRYCFAEPIQQLHRIRSRKKEEGGGSEEKSVIIWR